LEVRSCLPGLIRRDRWKEAAFLSGREIAPGGFNFEDYLHTESACKKRRVLFLIKCQQFVSFRRR
jgi:hypothetical protein